MGALIAWLGSPAGAVVASVAMTLATWTYHKVRGDAQASLADTVRGVGKQIVDALVKSGDLTSDALTARATSLMNAALGKLGIDPTNALVKAVTTPTIQHAVGDALAELRKIDADDDAANTQLASIAADAQKLPAEMAAAAAKGAALVAPMKDLVEVVP